MVRKLYLFVLLLFSALSVSYGNGIINTGNTYLGVGAHGYLNIVRTAQPVFPNDPRGNFFIGVFREGVGDAISPGCQCEAWGVLVTRPDGSAASGHAGVDNGGIGGVGSALFGTGPAQPNGFSQTATSIVNLNDAPVQVQHLFGPSLAPDVFQVNVRITNTSTDQTFQNVFYRRSMDWDVPPTEFSEFVTHQGVVQNLTTNGGNVVFASDNGFASGDLLSPAGSIIDSTINSDFGDSGPFDHGSVFDFQFGSLAPGESVEFNIFYGSAANETDAIAALQLINVANADGSARPGSLYSLGQSTRALFEEVRVCSAIFGEDGDVIGEDCRIETRAIPTEDPANDEATFIFAFGGVGGTVIGETPENPVLPFVPAPGEFVFPVPIPRRWYDPPYAKAYDYELVGGATFTKVAAPPPGFGYGTLTFESILGSFAMDAGVEYDLAALGFGGLSKFTISGIKTGLIDSKSPAFSTLFPTFLDWSGTVTELKMKALFHTDIPEPSTWLLVAGGTVLIGLLRKR